MQQPGQNRPFQRAALASKRLHAAVEQRTIEIQVPLQQRRQLLPIAARLQRIELDPHSAGPSALQREQWTSHLPQHQSQHENQVLIGWSRYAEQWARPRPIEQFPF